MSPVNHGDTVSDPDARQVSEFDMARLNWNVYNNLCDASDKVNFMQTVEDYLDHLRADTTTSISYDEAVEAAAAQNFLRMVNNEIGWDLARVMMPEFQSPVQVIFYHPT